MFDKNEYQAAGQSMAAFISEMQPYLEQGYLPDAESATHYWPSTFVVTMKRAQVKKQQEDNKPVRQRQQKTVDKQE